MSSRSFPAPASRAPATWARSLRLHALLWGLTCVVCIFVGASVAGRTQTYLGDQAALIVIVAASACALFITFGAIGFPAVIAWGAVTGLAYPFVRFGSLVSFDRLWVVGMVGSLALARGIPRHSRESRSVLLALYLLALTFGLRAVATGNGAVQTWIDAILVPLVLFVVIRSLARTAKRV